MKYWLLALLVSISLGSREVPWTYKGMTIVADKYCPNVTLDTQDAEQSFEQLKRLGANSVAIVVTWYQVYLNSTEIHPVYDPIYTEYYTYRSETEEAVISAIKAARKVGLTVMVKPHIDIIYPPTPLIWRGHIGIEYKTEQQWDEWFSSYSKFILRYAQIAQQYEAELYSVSCELINASPQETRWRRLVAEVRSIYKGIVTSSANWGDNDEGEDIAKQWWDILDFIGIDAYYPVGNETATIQDIMQQWNLLKPRLQTLSEKYNKKIVFTEVGYCSGKCKRDHKPSIYDQFFQSNRYTALIQSFINEPYFDGVYWWAWNVEFAYGGLADDCISPQWKPAQQVLQKFYGGKDELLQKPKTQAKCACTV